MNHPRDETRPTTTQAADARNPKLSPLVRVYVVVLLIIVAGGSTLLFGNAYVTRRWPWPLTAYAAHLLGAVYLSEFVAAAILFVFNRVAPGRMILAMALPFALLGAVVPFLYPALFDFSQWKPIAWFLLYGGSTLLLGLFLWRDRKLPHPGVLLSAGWRGFFLGQGIVVGLFALALLFAPRIATSGWPWPVNTFDAQFYSGVVLSIAVGSILLFRHAAVADLVAFGVIELAFGGALLTGFALTRRSVAPSDWEHVETMPWSFAAGCAVFILLGLASLAAARSRYRADGARNG
jgi:hypothetical protein